MMDDTPTTTDESIADKSERLEEIITQLEDGEVSLERAKELHSEGETLLEELEMVLDINGPEIIERS